MSARIDRLVHDARGPLNTITVNAELAQLLHRKGGDPARLQQALAAIVRESQRCDRILQDFRDELQDEPQQD